VQRARKQMEKLQKAVLPPQKRSVWNVCAVPCGRGQLC